MGSDAIGRVPLPPRVTFGLLGSLQVRIDGNPALPSPQLRWLLAVLLLHNGDHVSSDDLLTAVWGPDSTSRGAFATAVSRLRTWLARVDVALEHVGDGYRLCAPPATVDADRFRALVIRARDDHTGEARLSSLGAALAEWRDSVLAGGPEWLIDNPAVAELNMARLACAQQFGELALTMGLPDAALGQVSRLTTKYEYDESLHTIHIRLLAAAGRPAEALRHYEGLRRRLRDELGVMPSESLQRAHHALLSNDRVLSTVAGDAPAFKPFQLPADLPDFVGRHDAVKVLVAALTGGSDGAYPAVASITGMPGTGKSALAVHAAHLLREHYPDGQIYLDLAGDDIGAIDPHDALGRVLLGLGFGRAGLPVSSDERSAALRSLCADRRLLLVLDNAGTASDVLSLLPASPHCGVLVTSRACLGGLGAWPEVEVQPLDRAEALDLLARIVGHQRTVDEPEAATKIVELCAGLPLAIRIAGTRLAVGPHHPLSWLADRLESEQTRLDELAVTGVALRSSFDISYHGLDAANQRALRLLGILKIPDFDVWLAAATLDCPINDAEDHIDHLIEVRLLGVAATGAVDVPRFRFHQLIRLYAAETATVVESTGSRADTLARAYGACLASAEHVDQRMHQHVKLVSSGRPRPPIEMAETTDPDRWFAAERGTLVAAVHACAELEWYDLAWDLSLTLQRFLESHHHFHDWLDVATAGLAAARTAGDRHAEPALLCSLGELHAVQDQYASAADAFEHALALAEGHGDRRAAAHALLGLSSTNAARGQLDESAAAARRALDLIDEDLDPGLAAETWMSLGATQHQQGELSLADASFQRALRGFIAVGDRMNQAILLVNMGTTYNALTRWADAEEVLSRSASLCREIGFRNGEGFAYTALGTMLRRRGETVRAEQALVAALTIVRDYADQSTESIIRINLGAIYRSTDLDRSREHLAATVTMLSDEEMPMLLVDALTGLGETDLLAGEAGRARDAWERARDLVAPINADRADDLSRRLTALG